MAQCIIQLRRVLRFTVTTSPSGVDSKLAKPVASEPAVLSGRADAAAVAAELVAGRPQAQKRKQNSLNSSRCRKASLLRACQSSKCSSCQYVCQPSRSNMTSRPDPRFSTQRPKALW